MIGDVPLRRDPEGPRPSVSDRGPRQLAAAVWVEGSAGVPGPLNSLAHKMGDSHRTQFPLRLQTRPLVRLRSAAVVANSLSLLYVAAWVVGANKARARAAAASVVLTSAVKYSDRSVWNPLDWLASRGSRGSSATSSLLPQCERAERFVRVGTRQALAARCGFVPRPRHLVQQLDQDVLLTHPQRLQQGPVGADQQATWRPWGVPANGVFDSISPL